MATFYATCASQKRAYHVRTWPFWVTCSYKQCVRLFGVGLLDSKIPIVHETLSLTHLLVLWLWFSDRAS